MKTTTIPQLPSASMDGFIGSILTEIPSHVIDKKIKHRDFDLSQQRCLASSA